MGLQHSNALKPEAKPICEPFRRRSLKEEEVESEAMDKLLKWGHWSRLCLL